MTDIIVEKTVIDILMYPEIFLDFGKVLKYRYL